MPTPKMVSVKVLCVIALALIVTVLPSYAEASIFTRNARKFCSLQPDAGPCRKSDRRYYYDQRRDMCRTFTYGGCKGNKNNFQTLSDCENACRL